MARAGPLRLFSRSPRQFRQPAQGVDERSLRLGERDSATISSADSCFMKSIRWRPPMLTRSPSAPSRVMSAVVPKRATPLIITSEMSVSAACTSAS